MTVTTPSTIDPPRSMAPAITRPSRRAVSIILIRGHLVWLGWLWATLLVLLPIGLLALASAGRDLSESLWAGAGIAWQRWILFGAGLSITRVFLREFVARGVTRRRLADSTVITLLVITALCGAVGGAGYAIEAAIFRWQDWPHELIGGRTFAAGDTVRIALEHTVLGAAYYIGGWMVGAAYVRYRWVFATLLIPACLLPALIVELAVGQDTRNIQASALPDLSGLATVAIAVPVVAAAAVVAGRITRTLPLR